MEKTFCDYCGVEMPKVKVEVAAPDGHVDEETLTEIRKDCEIPDWVPTCEASLVVWDGDEGVDCCLDCLIKRLMEAKAIAEVEASR